MKLLDPKPRRRRFKKRLSTEIFPGRKIVPKTPVLATHKAHAERIAEVFREEFGQGTPSARRSPTSRRERSRRR